MVPFVLFTDLDGTLLDHHTYTFEAARPALKLLKDQKIPLVLCTSKTRAETEGYRALLENRDPFIVEDGGALFIPQGYFPFPFQVTRETDGYQVIELGLPYGRLIEALEALKRESGMGLVGFSDLSAAEVAERCGLSFEEAVSAKAREYDEPFFVEGEDSEKDVPGFIDQVLTNLNRRALNVERLKVTRGGRFLHLTGGSDKGRAVAILVQLFRQKLGPFTTVALGDSANDQPMLEVADFPILVQKENGGYDPKIRLSKLIYAPGVGPEGWSAAILELFKRGEDE